MNNHKVARVPEKFRAFIKCIYDNVHFALTQECEYILQHLIRASLLGCWDHAIVCRIESREDSTEIIGESGREGRLQATDIPLGITKLKIKEREDGHPIPYATRLEPLG